MTEASKSGQLDRRSFIKASTVVIVGSAAAAGAICVPLLQGDTPLLRPPGALEEELFLASCIKCGQCLQVCPPQVIDLAFITKGFSVGTPYITPREGGCILCAGLPCVLACPTGALDHGLSEGKDAKMGLAVISQPQTCLAIKGVNDISYQISQLKKEGVIASNQADVRKLISKSLPLFNSNEKETLKQKYHIEDVTVETLMDSITNRKQLEWVLELIETAEFTKIGCRICFDECPIKNEKTITFEEKKNPETGAIETWPVVQKSCVGCGVCEEKCPTPVASITITPRLDWKEETA